MAEHFLTKTQIELGQCLEAGDELAIEAYPALLDALTAHGGEETAHLFAEPLLSRGNDQVAPSVSWYTDIKGNATPFNRLDDAAQNALGQELTRRLAPLQAALGNEQTGSLIGSALHIPDMNDVWSVDGTPVIINWGMLPAGASRETETRAKHYAQTLGRFLPLPSAPPLSSGEAQEMAAQKQAVAPATPAPDAAAATAAATAAPVAAAAATADPTPPPPPSQASATPQRVPLWAWLPLLLLLLLAGGVLIWLLIPGNRIFPDLAKDRAVTDEAALAAVLSTNKSLEQRLADLQFALDGAVCEADGTLLMPNGRTIEGLLPPDPNDRADIPGAVRPADRTSILPPNPERVKIQDSDNPKDTKSLLAYIEERTAMVLAPSPEGLGSGTGFFVGPDLLVTNHHVIASPGATIYVTNNALGSLREAQVLKTFGPFQSTGGDFALLRVQGAQQPSFNVLDSAESLRLQSVIAAGYPGDLLQSDANFQQLRSGDRTAVPELAVTDGTVSAEQTLPPQTKVVVHSAPISKGNSGGPLVDMCGRLVGVNTFVKVGPMRSLNFALSTGDLMRFLADTGALPAVVTQTCAPQVQRPLPPETAQASGAAPESPAPETNALPKLPALTPKSE